MKHVIVALTVIVAGLVSINVSAQCNQKKGAGLGRSAVTINIPQEKKVSKPYACGSNEDGTTMMCRD